MTITVIKLRQSRNSARPRPAGSRPTRRRTQSVAAACEPRLRLPGQWRSRAASTAASSLRQAQSAWDSLAARGRRATCNFVVSDYRVLNHELTRTRRPGSLRLPADSVSHDSDSSSH
jgi:hypothetical protein